LTKLDGINIRIYVFYTKDLILDLHYHYTKALKNK